MNNKNSNITEYIFTFLLALFVVFIFSLCIELNLLFATEQRVNQKELNMANLSKFCTISELEKRLFKEPSNYLVDIKIAQIYESLNEYDKANDYYISALKKSARSDFSLYSYALFCAKHDLYGTAATVAEELSTNNKFHNMYKAKIYETLGDNLDMDKQYPASNKAYQVAYKYSKAMNDNDYEKIMADKFANSYIKVADCDVTNNNPQEAILNLNNSIRIKDTSLARYKLGLIYVDFNKVEADRFISSAFKNNPYLVNPYIYNKLLNDLILESKENNKAGLMNYYSLKLSRFKKQLLQYYIYQNDILITNIKIQPVKKIFSNKDKYELLFDIKNNTKYDLKSLFLQVELIVNSKIYTIEKKAVSYNNALGFYDELKGAKLSLPSDIRFINVKSKNDVIIKFYAKKTKNAPWTLIKIDQLNF